MFPQPNNGDYIVRLVKQNGVLVAICMLALFITFESVKDNIVSSLQPTSIPAQLPSPTAPPTPVPTATTPPPTPTPVPTVIPAAGESTSTQTSDASLPLAIDANLMLIVALTIGVIALLGLKLMLPRKDQAPSTQPTQLHSAQQTLAHLDYNHNKLERQLRTLNANDQAHENRLRHIEHTQAEMLKQMAALSKKVDSLVRESRIIYQPVQPVSSLRRAHRSPANATNGVHKNGTGPAQPDFDPFEAAGK